MAVQQLTHTLLVREAGGAVSGLNWTEQSTAGLEVNLTVGIADSVSDQEADWTCDFSELKSLAIWSDQVITIETNDGTTPDDTFVLVANQPLYWSENMTGITNPITADVTSIFISNSSGSTATLNIRSVQDPTP